MSKDNSSALLELLNEARAEERKAHARVASAASLYVAGKIDMDALSRFSAKSDEATRTCDEAEKAYRESARLTPVDRKRSP